MLEKVVRPFVEIYLLALAQNVKGIAVPGSQAFSKSFLRHIPRD